MVHIVTEDHGDVTIITVTRPAGVPVDWKRAIPAIASLFEGCHVDTHQGSVYQDTLGGSFRAVRDVRGRVLPGTETGPCLSRNCDC